MKKKNFYALALAAALSASLLAGCSGNKGNAGKATTTAAETSAGENEGSQSGTAAENGQNSPDLDTENGPAASGAENGSEDGGVETDKTLTDILEKVKEAYGDNYRPQAEMDAQMLKDQIGIGPDVYDSFIAEMPLISTFVETFIGIKAADGHAEGIVETLEAYRDRLMNDTMQYPMNVATIQAAQVLRYDDYVFFVMLGSVDDAELENGEEAALASAEKNNQIALDLIDEYFE